MILIITCCQKSVDPVPQVAMRIRFLLPDWEMSKDLTTEDLPLGPQ